MLGALNASHVADKNRTTRIGADVAFADQQHPHEMHK